MKKRTNGSRGALQYAATIETETAAIVATIAAAQTKLYASSSKGAAAEWKENPVQPVAVLDEALNMGLHFLRLRYLGDDTGHPDDRVVSQSICRRRKATRKSQPSTGKGQDAPSVVRAPWY